MIYTGQPIGLTTTFIDETTLVAIPTAGATPYFDYWLPGNATSTPSGTITGSFISGVATGSIPANVNTTDGYIVVQAKINDGTNTYRADRTEIEVMA